MDMHRNSARDVINNNEKVYYLTCQREQFNIQLLF